MLVVRQCVARMRVVSTTRSAVAVGALMTLPTHVSSTAQLLQLQTACMYTTRTPITIAHPGRKPKGGKQEKDSRSSSKATANTDEAPAVDLDGVNQDMDKCISAMKHSLSQLRAVGASPNMLDSVMVDAYGTPTPLPTLGQTVVKSPTILHVNVFDASMAEKIGVAIRDADLGLNPIVDGNVVKVPVPKTSKETRMALVKQINQIGEKTKQAVRGVRAKALDQLKKAGSSVPEDEEHRLKKEIQRLADDATNSVGKIIDEKVSSVQQE